MKLSYFFTTHKKQAEKLKSREIVKDEGLMMKNEGLKIKDEGFKLLRGFADRQTNEWTSPSPLMEKTKMVN